MIKIEKMEMKHFELIKDKLDEYDEFWNANILKSELESSLSKYIVAIDDKNDLVGFAGIIILPDDTEITNIVVKKSNRKQGIGKLLLEELINMSIKENKPIISLEVNEKNIPAISLYEGFDFIKVGRRKKYYNGEDDAIIMSKKIM